MAPTPLQLLAASAEQLNAKLIESSPVESIYSIDVQYADGSSTPYMLQLREIGQTVSVKEVEPRHLPGFCPQRHINPNGSFCLGWDEKEDMLISDSASSLLWWQRLYKYLSLQKRASKLKVWPTDDWAHGNAAGYQFQAESAAQALGHSFFEDLKQGRFTVLLKKINGRGEILVLKRHGQHVCSVWLREKMVANKRQPCICNITRVTKRKRMRSCCDHAEQITRLVLGLHKKNIQEAKFWESFRDNKCCGTMDGCRLKQG